MNSPVPLIPDNAPFSPDQRAWLNGFFAGVFSRSGAAGPAAPTQAVAPLTILFGSQTGSAEGPLSLAELARTALEVSSAPAIGMVMVVESAGLVGAALRRSPAAACR